MLSEAEAWQMYLNDRMILSKSGGIKQRGGKARVVNVQEGHEEIVHEERLEGHEEVVHEDCEEERQAASTHPTHHIPHCLHVVDVVVEHDHQQDI